MSRRFNIQDKNFEKRYEELLIFLQTIGVTELPGFRIEDIAADVKEQRERLHEFNQLKQAYLNKSDEFKQEQKTRFTKFCQLNKIVHVLYGDHPDYQSIVKTFKRKKNKNQEVTKPENSQ